MQSFDVVIVGAGHGGAQAAIALRQRKFSGSIAIVGEEPEQPYERPPLSKEYMAGERGFEKMAIRPRTFWADRQVEILVDHRVIQVDVQERVLTCSSGTKLAFGQMMWAAGGHARRLTCAGHALAGVHSIRHRQDVDRLVSELAGSEQVVVIGGGYIGLEAAAVLNKLGKRVTVIEALDRVLARVAGTALSRLYEAKHRSKGVVVRLNTKVDCIEEHGGRATGVRLVDGEVIPADIVVVGIGIVPSVQPLIDAGATGENGVSVDEHCQTSLPGIFAIGDCALHANAFAEGLPIRLESVHNANEMAVTAVRFMTGSPQAYHSVPWFWSNQYDLKLQTIGLSVGHDEEVVRGDPGSGNFSIVYLKRGRVVALDCVNSVKDFVEGRLLVSEGALIPAAALADTTRSLKEAFAASPVLGRNIRCLS